MAVDIPLLIRKRVTAAAIESDTGVAATLSASDAAMNVFDATFSDDVPVNTREGQGTMSVLPQAPGSRLRRFTHRTQLNGDSLWANRFLVASGFNAAGSVYTPLTGNGDTLTMGLYQDGRLYRGAGCMGDFTMNMTAGQPVDVNWDFTGVMVDASAASMLTPTYPTTVPPVFMGATVTVGGTSYKVAEVTLAMNNTVTPRQDATNAAGYHAAAITNRGLTITIDPEALALGTKDWWSDWRAGTEAALNIVVGSVATNIVTINCPAIQMTDIQPGDRDGILTDQLTFQSNRDAADGDDEISITLS